VEDPFKSKPKIAVDISVADRENIHNNLSQSAAVTDFESLPAVATGGRQSPEFESSDRVGMKECCSCGRTFNKDVIGRHESICGKKSTRKVFDSKAHRLAGLHANGKQIVENKETVKDPQQAPIRQPVKGGIKKGSSTSWRDKSNQLRAAIGAARATDPNERRQYEQELAKANQQLLRKCEYCGRSFNPEAAERHIPICQKKAQMIPRGSNRPIDRAVAQAVVGNGSGSKYRSTSLGVERIAVGSSGRGINQGVKSSIRLPPLGGVPTGPQPQRRTTVIPTTVVQKSAKISSLVSKPISPARLGIVHRTRY
jgi:hypothetical protein